MSLPVARLGDTSTHGGAVITSALRTDVEGQPVARMGDLFLCPKHGVKPIVSGSTQTFVEGAPVARLGDKVACGAILMPNTPKTGMN